MWIIKQTGLYLSEMQVFDDPPTFHWTLYRDNAKQFSSKQEAKDFKEKYSIKGSIIPA